MVLHQNKWDKKAKKAHVRKLKAKGKEDDTVKPKPQRAPRDPAQAIAEPEASSSDSESDSSDDAATAALPKPGTAAGPAGPAAAADEGAADDDDEAAGPGGFSRRKVQSNAWRYEEEEPAFPVAAGEDSEPAPAEPDYVALTQAAKGRLEDADEAAFRSGALDLDFLRESRGLPRAPGAPKGTVIRADRSQFRDVTEAITKQSTTDKFRARFAPRKQKARAPALPRGAEELEEPELDDVDSFLSAVEKEPPKSALAAKRPAKETRDLDDVDAFLGELEIGDGAKTGAPRPPPKLGAKGGANNDEWLDGMLS